MAGAVLEGQAEGQRSGARLDGGDGIRALAALAVLVFHSAFVARLVREDYDVRAVGHDRILSTLDSGVYVFVVLSGYLIARPFLHAFLFGMPQPRLLPYARRRLARIVPALWLFAGLTLLIVGREGSSWQEVAAVFAMAQVYAPSAFGDAIGQAWSIDLEMAFYLLVPLVAAAMAAVAGRRWSPRGRALAVVALVLVVSAPSLALRLGLETGDPLFRNPLGFLYVFAPGVLLATAEPFVRLGPGARRAATPAALGVAVLGAALIVVNGWIATYDQRYVLQVLGAGCLLAAAIGHQWATGRGPRWLLHPALVWLGERSYGVYLAHGLVLTQLHPAARALPSAAVAQLVLILATAVVSVAAAALSYRLVERPAIAWARGRRRTPQASAHREPAPATARA